MASYDALQSLGLKPAEIAVYTALLKQGPSSIRSIAQLAKVNRGTTYESLKRLAETGLVSFTLKGERRKYRAESPDRIYQLIEDRRRTLTQLEQEAGNFVPELLALGQRRLGEPSVKFYEDDEGIAVILRDVLDTVSRLPRKHYWVYSSRPLRKYLYRRFPSFTARRIQQRIFVNVIAIGQGGEVDEQSERKWIPEPPSTSLSSYVIIYGTKVALISVSADDTPYGVVIEEPGVSAMQKLLFDTLWATLDGPAQI